MTSTPQFHVRLYSRPGCCLCEDAAHLLEQLRPEYDFIIQHVNIDDNPELKRKLCCQIPVVTINGGNRVALRVTLPRLRRAFEHAAKRRNRNQTTIQKEFVTVQGPLFDA